MAREKAVLDSVMTIGGTFDVKGGVYDKKFENKLDKVLEEFGVIKSRSESTDLFASLEYDAEDMFVSWEEVQDAIAAEFPTITTEVETGTDEDEYDDSVYYYEHLEISA